MDSLLVERAGGIVTLTLNRPERKNAIDDGLWGAIREAIEEVAGRDEDRVLVITGAGGAFCSGADLSNPSGLTTSGLTRMRMIGDVALRLHRLQKPTIAKVGGVAAGAGCNLALGCDLVIAGASARFSEIFARRGLSLDFGGSWLLPRLVGLHKAKELAFLADVISADEAERIGIVNRVVPDDLLDAEVDDVAARIAAGPPIALSLTKAMLNQSMSLSMEQALEIEAQSQNVNFATKDFAEAVSAFLDKREPRFEGR